MNVTRTPTTAIAMEVDVLGLVAFLWRIDESEVAKILRQRMDSVSERVAEFEA
jgi:hypothetical protein